MNVLTEILSSRVRAEIFRLLFGVGPAELHFREMVRASGCSVGTVQTEMKKLARLDLVIQRRDGNRLYYRANFDHPLYTEIRGMVLKTIGLVDILREAVGECLGIRIAFVFGSVAAHGENARSDIDLMVIGSVGPREVSRLLSGTSTLIPREINSFVLDVDEFIRRRSEGDHFITQLLDSPRIFVKGTDDDLAKLVR
jgi:predicted nucleotidyltransferase